MEDSKEYTGIQQLDNVLARKPKTDEEFKEDYDMGTKEVIKILDTKMVFKVLNRKTKKYDAIKIIRTDQDFKEQQLKEIANIIDVEHTNILCYYDLYKLTAIEDMKQYVVSMEYQASNLDSEILRRKEKKKSFTDIELNYMIKSGIDVLIFLDRQFNTSLFGLKPNNIFICEDATIKFADFGMAKTKEGQLISVNVSQDQQSNYIAPEMNKALKDQKSSIKINQKKCDIFSLGIILMRCIGLLEDYEIQGVNSDIGQEKVNTIIKSKIGFRGKYLVDIITSMTQIDKDSRCNVEKLQYWLRSGKLFEGKEKEDKPQRPLKKESK